ncbi:MAG: alkylhydroperoxidase-related (seleno)protein [Acidobacteriota bacterium]
MQTVSPREDLIAAHHRALERIAEPGTWWTGAERRAIAETARDAWHCELNKRRKAALTPFAVDGEHYSSASEPRPLTEGTIDLVHRLVTDPARLSEKLLKDRIDAGDFTLEQYVELIGVVTQIVSVDAFHYGMGEELLPLPEAVEGEPSRKRPSGAAMEGAWVPMVQPKRLDPEDADLYGNAPRTGNVIRALSLVPAEVRALNDLSASQYLSAPDVMKFGQNTRSISRAQMELVAGRVSSLNECFY